MSVKVFRHIHWLEFCSREFFDICDGAADANSPSSRSHRLLGTARVRVAAGPVQRFSGANQNSKNLFCMEEYERNHILFANLPKSCGI
jgi:hypothetical protein